MPAPILDFHTHVQNVYGMCCVHPALRPLAKNGLARIFERSGFNPALKRVESPLSRQLIVREVQSRFATFTFGDYLDAMQRNEVNFACALPIEPMATTRELLEIVRGRPEVIPFASVDFESGQDPVEQLRAHIASGCKGLKLHPIMQNIAPDDPRITALFHGLRGMDFPVIFHTGRMHYFLGARPETPAFSDPERFLPLLKQFPKQPIVFGHMGLLDGADAAIEIAAQYPNVFLEVSFQPAVVIARAMTRLGSKQILLGSDWPASEATSERAQIRKAIREDRQAERNILFENGAALLRRVGVQI